MEKNMKRVKRWRNAHLNGFGSWRINNKTHDGTNREGKDCLFKVYELFIRFSASHLR
jgi:hypothetical protein